MVEELFPLMIQTLTTAAEKNDDYQVKCFHGIPSPLTEEQKDEYVDTMAYLRNRLIQLNGVINIEYGFDFGLIGDIDNYSKLLQEHREQMSELVEYLFEQPNIFPNDPLGKYQALFLEEVLQGIIEHSNVLNKLLAEV